MNFTYHPSFDGKCYCGENSVKIRVGTDRFCFQYFCQEHDTETYNQWVSDVLSETTPKQKPFTQNDPLPVFDKASYVYEYRLL